MPDGQSGDATYELCICEAPAMQTRRSRRSRQTTGSSHFGIHLFRLPDASFPTFDGGSVLAPLMRLLVMFTTSSSSSSESIVYV